MKNVNVKYDMKDYKIMSVGQIVSQNIENARILQNYGIDFCCGGDVMLSQAAQNIDKPLEEIVEALEGVFNSAVSMAIDFNSWSLDLLIDYLVKFHHRYIRENGPKIYTLLEKVIKAHAQSDPHLIEVRTHFRGSLNDLHSHLDKEEQILFPLIYELLAAKRDNTPVAEFHCGTVANPIRVMMEEHDNEGERFRVISALTNGYRAPEHACGSYKLLLNELQKFEEYLHIHIHVENNILFLKAAMLEQEVM